ncbi:MAG: CHAT domain-containing protein [Planctomycetota bacterium]|nr:CHAT domain-containing protein [Planctomycetota bacterium]
MRIGIALTLCLLVLGAPAWAEEPPTTATAAAQVREAVAKGDAAALEALARAELPDPWLVADALLARGAGDAAVAFAEADAHADVAKLAAWVRSAAEGAPTDARRAALATAYEALDAGDAQRAIDSLQTLDAKSDDVVSVEIETVRARALFALGQRVQGAAAWFAAAERAEAIGWWRRAAEALHDGGVDASLRANYLMALSAFQRQQRIQETRGNKLGAAIATTNTALIYWRVGRLPQSLELHQSALEVFEAEGYKPGVALSLTHHGILLRALGRHDESMAHQTRALKLQRELGNQRGVADCLTNLANLHHDRNAYAKALALHQEALEIHEQLRNALGVQLALGNIGIMQQALGDLDAAIAAQTKALELARLLNDPRAVGTALMSLGNAHQARDEPLKAHALLSESLQVFEAIGIVRSAARAAINLSITAFHLGRYEEALGLGQKALAHLAGSGDADGLSRAHLRVGLAQERLGAYASAFSNMEQSIALARGLKDRAHLAASLNDTASCYLRVKRLDAAAKLLGEAFEMFQAVGLFDRAAGAAANLAAVHKELGELEAAAAWLDKAEAIAAVHPIGREQRAAHRINRALVLARAGAPDEATAVLEAVLAEAREHKETVVEAEALGNLAFVAALQLDHERALALRTEALALARELETAELIVVNAWGVAGMKALTGKPDESITILREVIASHLEPLLARLGDVESTSARERWRGLFEIGLAASRLTDDAASAFFFSEKGRAGALVESLGMDGLLAATVSDALRREERGARAAVDAAVRAYGEARRGGKRRARKAARQALEDARSARREVLNRIDREAKAVAGTVLLGTTALSDVQAVLREGEALVLISAYDMRSHAVVVTRTKATTHDLGMTSSLEDACRAMTVWKPASDPAEAVSALRTLVEQAIPLPPGTTRLLVAPDGAVATVPLAMLWPSLEVAYVPSGRVLAYLRSRPQDKQGSGVLALGDPDYAGRSLSPLPASGEEAKAVGTTTLTGKDATIGKLSAALAAKRYEAVHLACHGVLDTERPRLSSLALTVGKETAAGDDGELSALDVFRMRVPAELVVLSACETARGRVSRAEGVSGLMRAFLHAGAPRVIGSLWKVDDEATRALMVKFYELWQGDQGLIAAAALKQAQAHVRAQPKWKHPYYWAAWVLWGLPE